MRKIPATSLLLCLLSITHGQAQHSAAIIGAGRVPGSHRSIPANSSFDALDVKRRLDPSVEVVFRLGRRLSFATAFTPIRFERGAETRNVITDEFSYFDDNVLPVTVTMPGTVFASTTTRTNGHVKALVAMLYFDVSTAGRVRPFIGGGYGVGFGQRDIETETFVHPLLAELQGFAFDIPPRASETNYLGVAAAKAGLNIFATERLFVRFGGGYLNGTFGEVGVGFAF